MSAVAILALALAGLVAAGCDGSSASARAAELPEPFVLPAPAEPAESPQLRAHMLARAGYGPDEWSLRRIESLGVDGYLEEQLHPAAIEDPVESAVAVAFPSLTFRYYELIDQYLGRRFEPLLELSDAKLTRAILSRRQLEQVLTDFWFDHFNVNGADGRTAFALAPYERDAIRPHVLGRFEDLLLAVARHPAMLLYLDNHLSTRDGFVEGGKVRGLNENYARELLELHTVGARGGYDQQDVIAVARAFSGWTVGSRERSDAFGFFFHAEAHDQQPKQVMGELSLPAGRGLEDGLDVIRFLAVHQNTAVHLCRALAQRFVSEDPRPRLLADCAATFLQSGGDLRAVTRGLLSSSDFRDPKNFGTKVKRPFVLIASLGRATNVAVTRAVLDRFLFTLKQLGESPYLAHAPTGYPDLSGHWASGGTLVSRLDIVSRVVRNELDRGNDWGVGDGSSAELVNALAEQLRVPVPDDRSLGHAVAAIEARGGVAREKRLKEGALILLSSPEFLQH